MRVMVAVWPDQSAVFEEKDAELQQQFNCADWLGWGVEPEDPVVQSEMSEVF